MDISKPTLGYWKIRGLAQQIRYIFEFLKVPYDEVLYEVGDAPDYSKDAWNSVKQKLGFDFPNLPYLIDGDLRITESQAILRYVVNKYGKELLGKTPEDQALADQLYLILTDINYSLEGMKKVNDYMTGKTYAVGDYITYVDFQFLETLEFVSWITEEDVFCIFPKLQEYYNRMRDIPQIKEYMQSEKFIMLKFNNGHAKINTNPSIVKATY
eukprot:403372233